MTTLAAPAGPASFFTRAVAWLDERGKPAWIASMVIGFVLFWPVGLAILLYMIFRKKEGHMRRTCHHRRRHSAYAPTGNSAFDAYRTETLRRLEDEKEAFDEFLKRLRDARDKAEFDRFMDERSKAPAAADDLDAERV